MRDCASHPGGPMPWPMPGQNSLFDRLSAKLRQYSDTSAAYEWLESNQARVAALFENVTLRDFVFEPLKGVFAVQGRDGEREIRQAITAVAVANMVMAGLPGKLGVGVFVSMALEGWMAWVIATRVGYRSAGSVISGPTSGCWPGWS